ncbi:tyrosine-type recombinase/integrase [Hyphomicrobium sp. DY-1]|uniref:tyrosine-type recombinase/integrase n=1 Tax=Hyphomicrobium sp. DY-1 TaxID=3075650 RepID=UPI0039C27743
MATLILTLAAARDIKPGQTLWDDVVKGLHLRGFPGSAGWYFYYRTKSGRERRPALGKFPALTIEGARRAAKALAETVAQGGDPKAKWRSDREAPSVAELADLYLSKWVDVRNKASSQKQYRWVVENVIKPALGKKSVLDVTLDDVEALVERVFHRDPAFRKAGRKDARSGQATAPVMAMVTRACLSKMFTLAAERWKFIDPANHPVKGAKRYRRRKRRRLASAAELGDIGRLLLRYGLDDRYKRQAACVWTLFFCGARVNEVANAKGSALVGDKLVLQEHKTDEYLDDDKVVFLPACALDILRGLPRDPSGRIFGKANVGDFWRMLRREIGADDLQLRDARRTFASYGLSNGTTLDQLGQLLGHTDTKTTRGYAWLLEDKAKSAVNATADVISMLMLPAPNGEPRQLPQRPRALSLARVRGRAAGTHKTPRAPR